MTANLFTRILFLLILLLTFSFSIVKIFDYDVWWHLKTGEYIAKSLKIPYEDFFSLANEGKEWIDVHWLSQLLFFAIFSLAGFAGIQIFTFCVIASTIFLLYRIGGNERIYSLSILPLIYLAIYASKDRYLPRPDILSFLFSSLYFFILYRFHFQDKKTIYLLPPLQILWVNMHGSFILGPLLIFAFAAGQWLTLIFSRGSQKKLIPGKTMGERIPSNLRTIKRAKLHTLLIVLLIVLTINIFNPYGIKIYTLFETYIESFHSFLFNGSEKVPTVTIQEWFPTFSESASKYHHTFFPFYIVIAILGLSSFILNLKRFSPPIFLTFAGFFCLSLFALRNVSLFSLLCTAIIAHNILEFFSGLSWKRFQWKFAWKTLPVIIFLLFSLLLIFSIFDAFSNGYYIRHRLPMETNFGISSYPFPFGAAEFIKKQKVAGNLYNNFESGGFLIWSLYPQFKVFIDGRYIDPEFDRVNLQAAKDYEKWEELMGHYNVTCALLKFPSLETSYLITALSSSDQWKIVYLDYNSIIFLKDSPRNQEMIKEYSLHLPEFHERAHMKKSAFPFRRNIMTPLVEKELKRNPVDRYVGFIRSFIAKFQKEPFPIETLNRGYLLQLIGAYEASIEEYQAFLKKYPSYELVHFKLGLLYFHLGDYQRSLEEMQIVMGEGIQNFETFYTSGLSCFYLNRSRDSISFFEKAIEWKAADYSSHFFLSLSHLNNGNLNEAERYMKRAIGISPNSAEAYFNLGSIYLLKKDKIRARHEFLKALEVNPNFKEAQEELQKCNE